MWLFASPWTVAHQAPPSMEFSRQEYWSGLPFPSPGDLPDPGIEPGSPHGRHCRQRPKDYSKQMVDFPDAWRQEEKGMTEDEMAGWHHRLSGHEFEQAPGVGDEQGNLEYHSLWGWKKSETIEWLNWTELNCLISYWEKHVKISTYNCEFISINFVEEFIIYCRYCLFFIFLFF